MTPSEAEESAAHEERAVFASFAPLASSLRRAFVRRRSQDRVTTGPLMVDVVA